MSIRTTTLLFSVLAAFVAFGDCPRWISVMPLRSDCVEELAKDAADLGNTTIVDGIAWICTVNPEGNPVADRAGIYAETYRKLAPRLRELSPVRQGVLLQATMGHGGFPGSVTPWQLTVQKDGKSSYRMCPLDERFLAYVARTCHTLSDLKPDFFMVDDDTRMIWNGVPGCFCPLHLAAFEKRTGRAWTREQVAKMLASGDAEMSAAWEEVKVHSLMRFFLTIRANFSPEIPGMLCVVADAGHLRHAREFAQALAAPGQTPVVRGGGAPYHGGGYPYNNAAKDLFHVVETRWAYAHQLDVVGRDVTYLQELDTCPHTLWATSAARMYDHLVMLALEGCKGAKMWITRTGNYHEKRSAEAYRRIFRANKGLMEWASKTDFVQQGVVVPPCGPGRLNFGDRYLALTGIPYRFGRARPGEVTALTAATLARLSADEIRAILSGRAIADGSAALWLSGHGYSADVGVTAKPWNGKTIQMHEFMDGFRQSGVYSVGLADLSGTAPGAKVLTRLFNRPRMGDAAAYVAPGSTLFENARGGKVLVFAQPLPVQMPAYYEAALFSESYRTEIVKWLTLLGGGIPGGLHYLGAGPVTCEAGTTGKGENVFVLNMLDVDGDENPEMMFGKKPSVIERLQGDGSWKPVPFTGTGEGGVRLASPVLPQRPAIFRWE